MLTVISPAKTLDFETPWQLPQVTQPPVFTQPEFLDQSQALMGALKRLAPHDISALMAISEPLGLLNYHRFQAWHPSFTPDNAKPALLAFKGDVYTGLRAERFGAAELAFAQDHLRILSGLYGLLRPLDLMQAYRLEMGTRFGNARGADLYAFWGDRIADALNRQLDAVDSRWLINLASQEYFRAVRPKPLAAQVIAPVFKDAKNGQYKVISFFAKRARGRMAAYIVEHRLTEPEPLKDFSAEGYRYAPGQSSAREWVFLRDQS